MHTCGTVVPGTIWYHAPEPGEQVPSQDDHPWNPQARATTETVLREAMQALVRVQAHMHACEDCGGGPLQTSLSSWNCSMYDVMSSLLTTPTIFPVAPD